MLTQITAPRKIRKFVVYDLEWIREGYKPGDALKKKHVYPLHCRLVGTYDGARYRSFNSVAEFLWSYALKREMRGVWFYGHFAGASDMIFLMQELLEAEGYQVRACFSGSSAIIVTISKGKNAWTFLDSFWLLRSSLRKIGKWIGFDKGGSDNQDESEKIFYGPIAELRTYNERDCVILWRAIQSFEEFLLEIGGQLQPTIASCAMYLFRRKYLSRNIATLSLLNENSREGYVGSRVEVFKKDCQNAFYYDINSSFPYAMLEEGPGELIGFGRKIPKKGQLCDGKEIRYYEADVTIKVPKMYLPPLPKRFAGRVYFPTGQWRSRYNKTDIELLLEAGGKIIKTHHVDYFDGCHDLAKFASDLYDRRKNATSDVLKEYLKLTMNSGYGKFGENPEKSTLLFRPKQTSCFHWQGGEKMHPNDECLEMLAPGIWLLNAEVNIAHAHVPIASHITAVARRNLFRYLSKCDPDIYYCDTDSVITGTHLETSPDLGGLKLEHEIENGRFTAPKVYRVNDKVRAKGFSLSKDPNKQLIEYRDLVEGGEVVIARMMRLREMYRKGITTPCEKVYGKRLRKEQPKRVFEGNDSRPWSYRELQTTYHKSR